MIDQDTDVKKNALTKMVAGFAMRGTEKSQFIVDYQQTTREDSAKKPTQGLFAHWEAKF